MTVSRAALMSLSGCPVTGSRVLQGSIGPVVTLRLPLPLAGMLCVCVCVGLLAVLDLCARLQPVVQVVWELYFSGLVA